MTENEIFELTHLEKYRQDERKAHFSRRANYALGFYEHCGSWLSWTDYRDGTHKPLTESDIEEIWSKSEGAKGAIMLDNPCSMIDVEGEFMVVQHHILVRRMSEKLREQLRKIRELRTKCTS